MTFEYRIYLDQNWEIEDLRKMLVKDFSLLQNANSINILYSNDAGFHLGTPSELFRTIIREAYGIDATLSIDCPTFGANGFNEVLSVVGYFLDFYTCDMCFGDNSGITYLVRKSEQVMVDDRKSKATERLKELLLDCNVEAIVTNLVWQ